MRRWAHVRFMGVQAVTTPTTLTVGMVRVVSPVGMVTACQRTARQAGHKILRPKPLN